MAAEKENSKTAATLIDTKFEEVFRVFLLKICNMKSKKGMNTVLSFYCKVKYIIFK